MLSHPALWLALAVVVLLAANVIYFLRRNWEGSHWAVDYAQLNYPSDAPSILRWRTDGDTRLMPEIVWSHRPAQWQLLVDGQPGPVLTGDAPWVELRGPAYTGANGQRFEDFRHAYVLRPLPAGTGPDLAFTVARIDRRFYLERGMHFPDHLAQIRTQLPVGAFKRHPVSRWVDGYRYLDSATLAEADRIVREEMGVKPDDPVLVKMDKVIRHLRTCWANAGGVPKDAYRWQDPLTIFRELRDGEGKGWCTQNAQVYTFFANRAGVPTRYVFGATVQDNRLVFNGHSWAESYLADHGRWTFVDPFRPIIATFGRNGRPLNSADLLHLCRLGTLEGVTARIIKDWDWKDLAVAGEPGAVLEVPFALVSRVPLEEFNAQSIFKYRLPPNVEDVRDLYGMLLRNPTFALTNLKRYLFEPAPAYSLYPTEGANTYLVRRGLFVALVVSVVGLIAAL